MRISPNSISKLIIMLLLLIINVVACSSTPLSLFSTKIKATVVTANDINPDSHGRASPIVLRIYELKSVNSFNETDFFRLYDEEATSLGDDLISREEFELAPGEGRKIELKPNKEAQYFGVIAAFRNIDSAQWRGATALKLHKTNAITIQIEEKSITITQK